MQDRKHRVIPLHLWVTTLNFFVFSLMISWMIGLGQRSSRIPIIVAVAVLLAVINTDWLGWFRLNRYVAYFGMIAGAGLAIYEFFYGRQLDQLYSVANLLVYVQLPLMFQKKDHRIFDNWGIFLMLEMVVAALLNDNVLFGILLIPLLVVGCSAMVSLASYSSSLQGGTSATESAGWIPDLLRWLGQEQSWARRASGIRMLGLKPKGSLTSPTVGERFKLGWLEGLPMGIVIIAFAVVYFFALPRLHTGAYEGLGKSKALTGFSGTISLDDMGELMSNSDIALRVSMTDVVAKRNFQPLDPPYIRGTVVDTYDGGGRWHGMDVGGVFESTSLDRLVSPQQAPEDLKLYMDQVIVTVTEQMPLNGTEFSIPPFFGTSPTSDLRFTKSDWRLTSVARQESAKQRRRKYEFETRAFFQGKQSPFLIDSIYESARELQGGNARQASFYRDRLKLIERSRFPGLIELSEKVLNDKKPRNDLDRVLFLEDYLATSPDFNYSLLPSVDRQSEVDPIEDFATRHKTGHCQFFASTLAMMLRSQGIPSRIVLGFRPPEYNDVGRFLVVRQNYAHAWVEAWIPQDQLSSETFKIPDWVTNGAWIRLDPTPPDENSNAGGSLRSSNGQAFQAVEQLWQDLVMDMDSTRQSEAVGIFGAMGNGSISVVLRSLERTILQLQTRKLDEVTFDTNDWFSWRSGLVAMSLVLALGLVARFRNKFGLLSIWRKVVLRSKTAAKSAKILPLYFLQLNFALASLGLKRANSQTPLEFATEADNWLALHEFKNQTKEGEPLRDLHSIIRVFYAERYGQDHTPSAEEMDSIQKKIAALQNFSLSYRKKSFKR